ncbi:MAG: cupin domain-containing protein [Firmicutes bacterium]|nr:cupin domain-containing protein [Bacillota bacterium]
MAIVNEWKNIEVVKNPNHPELYQKEFVSAANADDAEIALSSVLYEKLKFHGAVTPHYHTVCEIIFITGGSVMAYLNGRWEKHAAGDTLVVPAGEIHSVVNIDKDIDSEQISCFIPKRGKKEKNKMFETFMVDNPKIEEIF